MPKIVKALTNVQISRLDRIGFNRVGTMPGLGLLIAQSVANPDALTKSWVYRVTCGNKRLAIGLGSFDSVSFGDALAKAREMKAQIAKGIDPLEHKKQLKSDLIAQQRKNRTFKECANEYLSNKVFANLKDGKQWRSTLTEYVYPHIGEMLVKDIGLHDIQVVLDPIWKIKNPTASKLRGRIESIINYGKTKGYCAGENPARWSGHLSNVYAPPSKVAMIKNMDAIPHSEIHPFMVALRKHKTIVAKALAFLTLTAVRSGAVRNARWDQFNLDERLWIIPKELTKTRKADHRVALSDQAIALLEGLDHDSELVFPAPSKTVKNKPLSDSTISKMMRTMRANGEFSSAGVPHGMRAVFSSWRLNVSQYSFELGEYVLGHSVGTKVSEAYQRGDGLDPRRTIMQSWADFIDSPYKKNADNVVPMRKSA
jgi:integrase